MEHKFISAEQISCFFRADKGDPAAQLAWGNCLATELNSWQEAAHWYSLAAEQGNSAAMNNLAYLLEEGLGVPRDLKAARKQYSKALSAGNPAAANNLGVLLALSPREEDRLQAAKLLREGADAGYAPARLNFARCCFKGIGVEKDQERAYRFLSSAAEQDFLPAQALMGLYPEDIGLQQEKEQALKLAAAQGEPLACFQLGCISYKEALALCPDASPEAPPDLIFQEKLRAARDHMWRAATLQEEDTLYHLPYRLYLPAGTALCLWRMLPWFEDSCEETKQAALGNLASLYQNACNPFKDREIAEAFSSWAKRAKKQPSLLPPGVHAFSGAILNRLGELAVERESYEEAAAYFEKAWEDRNDPHAPLNLFYLWSQGHESKSGFGWARRYLDRSQRTEALVLLGLDQERKGRFAEAAAYYQRAVEKGSVAGELLLAWQLLQEEHCREARRLLLRAAAWSGPDDRRNAFGTLLPQTVDSKGQEAAVHVAPWFCEMTERAAVLARQLLAFLDEKEATGHCISPQLQKNQALQSAHQAFLAEYAARPTVELWSTEEDATPPELLHH